MKHQIPCCNCKGKGIIPAFMHIENGRCFACNGSGKVMVDDEVYEGYLKKVEREKKGKYIVMNKGVAEYYNTEKEIYEKYGRFYSGEYAGWCVRQSYRDEHIIYGICGKREEQFILECQIEYAHYLAKFAEENGLVEFL